LLREFISLASNNKIEGTIKQTDNVSTMSGDHGEKELAEILAIKQKLFDDLEDLKKRFASDINSLNKAASVYRQSILGLYECGMKLSSEMLHIGETYPTIPWAAEFAKRSVDQEAVEKSRADLQARLWDEFIFPCMSAVDSETKEFQTIEKN